jgi:hypothetical protein
MLSELILPLSLVMSLVSFSLIAKWYIIPWLNARSRSEALTPLLLFHSFRHIGLAFLIVGVTAQPLDPRFSDPAAYGDLLAAVLALIALVAVRGKWSAAMPLVWLFNIVGLVDLINALFQGLRYVPNGHLGAAYFIPTVIVPALLVTHVLVFRLLLRGSSQ